MTTKSDLQGRRRFNAFALLELLVADCDHRHIGRFAVAGVERIRNPPTGFYSAPSNLKQLGMVIQLYAVDHGDHLPGPAWQGFYHVYDDSENVYLLYYLATYLSLPKPSPTVQKADVAICPMSQKLWKSQTGTLSNIETAAELPRQHCGHQLLTNDIVSRPFGYPYHLLPNAGGYE